MRVNAQGAARASGLEENNGNGTGSQSLAWTATTPATDYPPLRGSVAVDVAVVGGGITGLTAAALLKERGARVAPIEARRVATGTTGNTTAKATSLHRLIYTRLISSFGEEQARLYADANQAALAQIARFVDERAIDCGLRRLPAYTYALSEEHVPDIEEEVEAATRLGLPASFADHVPLPVDARAAVRFDEQIAFHPRAYCLALAASLPGEDSHVFEQTRILELDDDGPRCRLVSTGAASRRTT